MIFGIKSLIKEIQIGSDILPQYSGIETIKNKTEIRTSIFEIANSQYKL